MVDGVPENGKIMAFLNNLPKPDGARAMGRCIQETKKAAMEASKTAFEGCPAPDLTGVDMAAHMKNNDAAVRMFCLNKQLLDNNCIPVTDEITNIQNVLNPNNAQ